MSHKILSLQGLGKLFQKKWILRDVSLTVNSGESIVILGPSGGGKSLFLKLIAGLVKPDTGKVICQTNKIGMMFQRNALFDSFTVEENLLFTLRETQVSGTAVTMSEGERKTLAKEFLEAVGLSHSARLYPSEISGGMQKRLGIARALILKPELLLCDEPTSGLDPITSRSIAKLMVSFRAASNVTMITVTNDLHRAFQLGKTLYFLIEHQFIYGGTPDEVQKSRDPSIQKFLIKKTPEIQR